MLDWGGGTERNQYHMDTITDMCVLLISLVANVRWYDLEHRFEIMSSHMSEVFWELVELFIEKFRNKVEMRPSLIWSRAEQYYGKIFE